jgi:hypothetical protein
MEKGGTNSIFINKIIMSFKINKCKESHILLLLNSFLSHVD